jgi:hypothetical protein
MLARHPEHITWQLPKSNRIRRSAGPLVRWSAGPLVRWCANFARRLSSYLLQQFRQTNASYLTVRPISVIVIVLSKRAFEVFTFLRLLTKGEYRMRRFVGLLAVVAALPCLMGARVTLDTLTPNPKDQNGNPMPNSIYGAGTTTLDPGDLGIIGVALMRFDPQTGKDTNDWEGTHIANSWNCTVTGQCPTGLGYFAGRVFYEDANGLPLFNDSRRRQAIVN